MFGDEVERLADAGLMGAVIRAVGVDGLIDAYRQWSLGSLSENDVWTAVRVLIDDGCFVRAYPEEFKQFVLGLAESAGESSLWHLQNELLPQLGFFVDDRRWLRFASERSDVIRIALAAADDDMLSSILAGGDEGLDAVGSSGQDGSPGIRLSCSAARFIGLFVSVDLHEWVLESLLIEGAELVLTCVGAPYEPGEPYDPDQPWVPRSGELRRVAVSLDEFALELAAFAQEHDPNDYITVLEEAIGAALWDGEPNVTLKRPAP
jgi:hypothetical protein